MSPIPIKVASLTPILGGLFQASAGQLCLSLADIVGNSDFDTVNCQVSDITATPSIPVPNDSLTAKAWCFTLFANKKYEVQVVVAQLPAIATQANLSSGGTNLMVIDSTNQIQLWTVRS